MKWRQIAQWNSLTEPYRLRLKQALRLETPPTQDAVIGGRALLTFWRKHFELSNETTPVVERLKPGAIPLVIPVKKTERLSAEKLVTEGQDFVKAGNFKDALTRFAEAAKEKPDYLPARLGEIRSLKELERTEEARAAARALLNEHPEYEEVPFLHKLGER